MQKARMRISYLGLMNGLDQLLMYVKLVFDLLRIESISNYNIGEAVQSADVMN